MNRIRQHVHLLHVLSAASNGPKTNVKRLCRYKRTIRQLADRSISLARKHHTYEIKLEEGDLLQQINSKLLDVRLNDVKFSESNGQIIVTLPFNVNIEFKRDSCPKLMTALNIIDDAYVIRGEQLKIQFLNTRPASSIKDESFNVIIYKVFPTTRKETKSETFFIPSGMYHQAKDLFKEFKFVFLQLTADSRVRLHVPQNILVTFGERLKDSLGFVQRTFNSW
ncbi:uncharacterized protein TNIN_428491 [Trichonephila inaurata madagascariensis]|uniref:Uncharacterized protein n=1 Tax=Trichonephila inaurata madagascariensis TaxID=2747483 RepID=A0A8X6WQN1_9ARAC|nr:uncharacterized protein TNIN_428491 [Trichonephila inaurata madagascariensis]